MQVNGYQVREALKRWNLRRDTLSKQIEGAAWAFPGETKEPAVFGNVLDRLVEAEGAVATLEDLQQSYNQKVAVALDGKTGPLSLLVKQVRFSRRAPAHPRGQQGLGRPGDPDRGGHGQRRTLRQPGGPHARGHRPGQRQQRRGRRQLQEPDRVSGRVTKGAGSKLL